MELVEGEDLAQRIASGPLSLEESLPVAKQIAESLEAAHEKGIVHRDLKPENLFVTKDGRVKILDFGLARALGGPAAGEDSTLAATEPGAVLGTAGYMAPEQVRGRPADARSDIFAFGAVLYEMLAGRRAFDGESKIERAHAILSQDPPELSASGVAVPPAIERIVRRCLEKSPDERFQSTRDLAFALEAPAEGSGVSGPQPAVRTGRTWRGVLLAVAAVALLGAGTAVGGLWRRAPASPSAPPRPTPITRFTIELPPGR